MSSDKKSRLEKEKERLEALQNTERKYLSGMYGDFFGGKIDELEQKGREVTSQFSSKADALLERQKAVSAELENRKDALQRANDALREVQSLLDNPLYNGMPSLTGKDSAGSAGTGAGNLPDMGGEIDPGLMAGTGGDLFTGFVPGNANPSAAPGAVQTGAPKVQEQESPQKPAEAAKPKEPEKDPMEELDALIG